MLRRPVDEASWLIEEQSGAGILRARYSRQRFPRHTHECFVVCVNERGAHASWYRDRHVIIPERAVTVVPPELVHSGQAVPGLPWHYRAIYPGTHLVEEIASELGMPRGTPSFAAPFAEDTQLADAFIAAHRRIETSDDDLEREGLVVRTLMKVIGRLAREGCTIDQRTRRSAGVERALDLIRSCYARRLSLAELGRAAGVSRYSLIRAFDRDVGMSPYTYLMQVRVERAVALLRAGVSIAAAAQRVGFADQSHLSRTFKRWVGVTPGAFARAVRPRLG